MSDGSGDPLFDSIMKQNLMSRNVFAFYMSMNEHEPSELIFGWIDYSRFYAPM